MRKLIALFAVSLGLVGCQTIPPAPAPAPAVAATRAAPRDPFWPRDGIFSARGQTSSWSGFRAKNVARRTLFAAQRELDQGGIVFVGDSLTEGWQTLAQDFSGLSVKVVNRGISGDTTPHLLYRLEDDVLALHPRALVVLIGTNDLGEHTAPEDIAENLKMFHRRVRSAYPHMPVAWCLVMPRSATDTYPARVRALNTLIKKIAAADPYTTICDTYTAFALPDGSSQPSLFAPDRLHLIASGYAGWRQQLWPIISAWRVN